MRKKSNNVSGRGVCGGREENRRVGERDRDRMQWPRPIEGRRKSGNSSQKPVQYWPWGGQMGGKECV